MKVLENFIIDYNDSCTKHNVYFLRVDPEDISITLQEILEQLLDLSWLEQFTSNAIRKGFEKRASTTAVYLKNKLLNDNDLISSDTGEYVVSVLSKEALVKSYGHESIPLSELLGRKVSNNPSYDFYTISKDEIVAGEAKFLNGINAYGTSLEQINRFIKEEKHISDIPLLAYFSSENAINRLSSGLFHVCASFSTTKISTDRLIKNIINNSDFKELIKEKDIFLVAVNMYEK